MKKSTFLWIAIIVSVFVGCSKDDGNSIKLSLTEKTLHFGEEYQIEVEEGSNLTFISANEYHAVVSDTGLVSALFVGETNIIVSNGESSATLRIIVAPQSNLYKEPCLDWEASRETIIEQYGTPDSSDGKTISYTDYSTAADLLSYMFENDRLKGAGVLVKSKYVVELAEYLAERYLPLADTEEAGYVFVNGVTPESITTIVSVQTLGNYFTVIYLPYSSDKTRSESDALEIFDHFENLVERIDK
ncbi:MULTISPECIES: hypothetical protein [unclassified Alistipes]|uniref:hypothetical protein n=1 Tax=unclassified Alistipes TaxID=2608932 RepID=UPI0007A91CB3|nr:MULTISPECIES: hypothetical protein [unclassified Alistipes]CVI71820.1 hypothetical protein BN3659_02311 [Alistipes sp. CHKCI003]